MRYLLPGLLCWLLIGCSNVQEPESMTQEDDNLPDQEIWDGKVEISSDGRTQSIVQAGHIESFEKKKITFLDQGVIIDFYNKKGEHTSQLTAKRVKIEERTDLFRAEDSVVVVSDSGAVLRTPRLYWDKKRHRISSDTLVIMTTEFDSLRGYDFESNEDLTSWQLKRPTGQSFRQRKK